MSMSKLRYDIMNNVNDNEILKNYKADDMMALCDHLNIPSGRTTKIKLIARLKSKLLDSQPESHVPESHVPEKPQSENNINAEIAILANIPIGDEDAFVNGAEGKKYTLTKLRLICTTLGVEPRMKCRANKENKTNLLRLLIAESRNAVQSRFVPAVPIPVLSAPMCDYPEPSCSNNTVCDIDRKLCLNTGY